MPARLIAQLLKGPFSSDVSTGRVLTVFGELSLTTLQVLAIYSRGESFSPIEFATAYGAILAAGGFAVAKVDAARAEGLARLTEEEGKANR